MSYAYDAFGRRMSKTVGSSTPYYLYDGDALIAEVDASTNQVTRSYTWGADGLVSDRAGSAFSTLFLMLDNPIRMSLNHEIPYAS